LRPLSLQPSTGRCRLNIECVNVSRQHAAMSIMMLSRFAVSAEHILQLQLVLSARLACCSITSVAYSCMAPCIMLCCRPHMGNNKRCPCNLFLASSQSDRVADGEPQGAKLALPGVVWKTSRALAQLAGSNVRKEASATLWKILTLRCTDTRLAPFSSIRAHKAVWKRNEGLRPIARRQPCNIPKWQS
jgi:hypothetical protein